MKMKRGDRVKLPEGTYVDYGSNPIWGGKHGRVKGTIYELEHGVIRVKWDNGYKNNYFNDDLKVIEDFKPLDDLMKFIEKELVI